MTSTDGVANAWAATSRADPPVVPPVASTATPTVALPLPTPVAFSGAAPAAPDLSPAPSPLSPLSLQPAALASLSAPVRAVLAPAIAPGTSPAVPPGTSPAMTTTEAEARTRHLVDAHYENFAVVSLLLPRAMRQDFCNIYAFCRVADDLGDELDDPAASTAALAALRRHTLACRDGRSEIVLFTALGETLKRHDIPVEPLLDLIDAFEQDQRVTRYETFADVVDYCRRSANPVGRLVLYLCGYRDEARQALSDVTCTALQLANFWQDVRRDLLDRDRIYLPAEDLRRFGVSESDLRQGIEAGHGSEAYTRLIEFEVDRTARLFDEGDALLPMLDPAVRGQVALYGKGGRAVVEAIRAVEYDTLARRPEIGKWQKGRLVLSALTARVLSKRPGMRLVARLGERWGERRGARSGTRRGVA